MKKKILLSILFFIILPCLNLITACNENIVKFDLNFIVDNQTYYVLSTAGNETITLPQDPTKNGYEFDGWYWDKDVWENPLTINSFVNTKLSNNMSVYAKFNRSLNNYSVTWKNYNGSILDTEIYVENSIPVYKGQTPTKTKDAQYTYTFKGWDKEITAINENTIYIAQYDYIVNKYTVTFKNYDGTTLQTIEVEYGQNAEYSLSTPTKPSTAQYTYTFSKWDKSLENITENTEVVAEFGSVINCYTITWQNYNGDILEVDSNVEYGTTPSYNATTPTKECNAQYTYVFNGWDPNIVDVVGNATYTAKFLSSVNQYDVIFKNYDDTILLSIKAEYGMCVSYSGSSPTRTGYSFESWDYNLNNVITHDTIITAIFIPNNYEISYFYESLPGLIEQIDQDVTYDSFVTLKSNNIFSKKGYTISKWSNNQEDYDCGSSFIYKIAGGLNLNPIWEANTYSINYELDGGINNSDNPTNYTIETETITLKNPTKNNYSFKGWKLNNEDVTEIVKGTCGNLTLTATWVVYGLEEINYNSLKRSVSINDALNAELFDATCYDTDGNEASVNVEYTGIFSAGNEITIKLVASYNHLIRQVSFSNVKVYGMPTLNFDDTINYFNIKDGLTADWFNASGKDTYNEDTIINVYVNEDYIEGDIVTIQIESVDKANNKTTGKIENVKAYGLPIISYNNTITEVKLSDILNPEYFSSSAKDSFNEDVDVTLSKVNFEGGSNATVSLSATDSKGNTKQEIFQVKVYDLPIINNPTKTDFKVGDAISVETLGLTATDSFNKQLDVEINLKSGTQTAGTIIIYTATVIDHLNNIKTKDIEIRIYDNPMIIVERTDIKDTETISISTFNVTAKDSFDDIIDVSYEYISGSQTGGTEMWYRFLCIDNAGNITSVIKQIKVYSQNDIELFYGEYSDLIKASSKGEEFSARANDTFGQQCDIVLRPAEGYYIIGGRVISLHIVAIDKAGNERISDVINNIKVYDTPYAVRQCKYVKGMDISTLFKVYDSFDNELLADVSIVEEIDDVATISIIAIDIVGNRLEDIVYSNECLSSAGLVYSLKNDNTYEVTGIGFCDDKDLVIGSYYNRKKITSIGIGAFRYCEIESVIIGNNVGIIDRDAFYGCYYLNSVFIPESINTIKSCAFFDVVNLNFILIPTSVNKIESHSFYPQFYEDNPYSIKIFCECSSKPDSWDAYWNGGHPTYWYSEEQPTEEGNYWHYVNDVPTIW